MKLLLVIGACLRLINSSPFETKTYRIYDVTNGVIVSEAAIQTIEGWVFKGQDIAHEKYLNPRLENVVCPKINWNK